MSTACGTAVARHRRSPDWLLDWRSDVGKTGKTRTSSRRLIRTQPPPTSLCFRVI